MMNRDETQQQVEGLPVEVEIDVYRGVIAGIHGGSWMSGMIQIRIDQVAVTETPVGGFEVGTEAVLIPADNAPTIRALEAAFGGVIDEGHTFNPDAVIGKEIYFTWDDMGMTLAGFTPVEEAGEELRAAWLRTLGLPSREDIVRAGIERGEELLKWADTPEVGEEVDEPDVEVRGVIETLDEAEEVFQQRFYAAEENNRQYSPFEFTAAKLNCLESAEIQIGEGAEPLIEWDVWEAYEEGISAALDAEVAVRFGKGNEEGGGGNE